ncbi:MAG TPA: phytanoyl-CoA dioxygenase family protein [Pyrinomonadaceae bacterium]|jgi:hypothetical protein
MSWQDDLRTQGFCRFESLTPQPLLKAAREAIERDLRENYRPERQLEYDHQSYCPDLRGTPPIMNLLTESPIRDVLDEALGLDEIGWDGGQIAIRRAHNHPQPEEPVPHIDGFASGLNGLEERRVYSLTALVGVFLTPVVRPFAGNFTVWPGSHYVYESYFRRRGIRAMSEPMPTPDVGRPTQLMCGAGDAVLFHYQLAHTAAVNTSDDDRIAVYFRIWLHAMEQDRWRYLTNIWDGWKI